MEKVIHFIFFLKLIVENIRARMSWTYSSQPICVIHTRHLIWFSWPAGEGTVGLFYFSLRSGGVTKTKGSTQLKIPTEERGDCVRNLSLSAMYWWPTWEPDTSLGLHWSPPQLTSSSQKIREPRSVRQSQPLTSTVTVTVESTTPHHHSTPDNIGKLLPPSAYS